MSLVVTVIVPTGIVMSGDSRTTYVVPGTPMQVPAAPAPAAPTPAAPTPAAPAPATPAPATPAPATPAPATPAPAPFIPTTGLVISDSTYKVFLLYKKYGVSTCGASFVDGMPIAHHIDEFELSNPTAPATPHDLSTQLLAFFRTKTPVPITWFQVTGYNGSEPWIELIDVNSNAVHRMNSAANRYGAWWNGDFAIVSRLAATGNAAIDCSSLNVQDAIDLSRHLIRTTIDQMRFELNFPTVGGPIDTLVTTTKTAEFLFRKELRCH